MKFEALGKTFRTASRRRYILVAQYVGFEPFVAGYSDSPTIAHRRVVKLIRDAGFGRATAVVIDRVTGDVA